MNSLHHIIDKYNICSWNIDLKQKGPYYLSAGRNKCLPNLFNELGFKIGAEIGVARGTWAKQILKRMPQLKLYLVDLWEPYAEYLDFPDEKVLSFYPDVKENVKGYNVEFIKEWSHIAAEQFEDESLDFVYIDANHIYEYVVQDLACWSKKVRKGGIVCGHDYNDFSKHKNHCYMQVVEAVNGWCAAKDIDHLFVLTNNPGNTWMYVK